MGLTSALPNAIIQPGVCTSTTRPTSPYNGQTIYETDTGSLLVYYGATTGWRLPWNQPWGFVASTASQSNTISGGYLTGVDTNITAIANRRYKITAHATMEVQSGRVIIGIASSVDGVLFRTGDLGGYGSLSYPHSEGTWIGTLTAGAATIRIQVAVISGVVNGLADSVYNQHRLYIEDIGPATSTAPTS